MKLFSQLYPVYCGGYFKAIANYTPLAWIRVVVSVTIRYCGCYFESLIFMFECRAVCVTWRNRKRFMCERAILSWSTFESRVRVMLCREMTQFAGLSWIISECAIVWCYFMAWVVLAIPCHGLCRHVLRSCYFMSWVMLDCYAIVSCYFMWWVMSESRVIVSCCFMLWFRLASDNVTLFHVMILVEMCHSDMLFYVMIHIGMSCNCDCVVLFYGGLHVGMSCGRVMLFHVMAHVGIPISPCPISWSRRWRRRT